MFFDASGRPVPANFDTAQSTDVKCLQPFEYLLVLDFEATCWDSADAKKPVPVANEIIEFPCVVLNTATNEVEAEFHKYVRPTERPKLTEFCTYLTGIQQKWVDAAEPIESVMKEFATWVSGLDFLDVAGGNFTFVTCGDWDLKTCLPKEAKRKKMIVPEYMKFWVNLKRVFTKAMNCKPGGMDSMLKQLDLPLIGRHHSGIDDARNICAIARKFIEWQIPVCE